MKNRYLAIVFGLLTLSLVVLINLLAHQYNVRLDLTKSQQHTLSPETLALLSQLKETVTLTALHVGLAPKYMEDMLASYERHGEGTIKTKIIDPLVDIGYAAQFGNIITGKQKKLIVQTENDRRDIDFSDDVLSEELVTNAIMRVTRSKRRACFTKGHGEYDLDDPDDNGLLVFNKLLANNGIDTYKILLKSTGEVPQDCDVLVIAGPKLHFLEEEIAYIKDYLQAGGDALFLIEHTVVTTPDKPLTQEELELNPSLNGILNEWGVNVLSDVVVDTKTHASGDVGSPATNNYLSHRAIVDGLDYTFYVRPRSISLYPDRRKSLKVAPIVLTMSAKTSWGESDRTLKVEFDPKADKPGPVPIAFVMMEEKEEDELSDTRIIVFTDADFLTNAYIGAYSNGRMGLNIMSWLSETDFKPFLHQKSFEVEKLSLLSHQKKRVRHILLFMPLSILLSGIAVWGMKR